MNMLKQFKQASRMHFLPMMLICIVLGALAAYLWDGEFHVLPFLITLIGSGAAHLFSTMYNDIVDYRSGVDPAAFASEESLSTDSGYLTQGIWSLRQFAAVCWSMLGIAVLCCVYLAFYAGWWALGLGLIGVGLAYFYVGAPVRFGYWGRGTSEAAHVIAFGILPVMGAYYVQTSHFDSRLLLLSLPMGLLTTLTFFNHHFLHWRTDRQAGKYTLVVMWGESKSFRLSPMLLGLACLSIALCVWQGILPIYAIAALAAAWPVWRMYGRMYGPMRLGRSLQTYQSLMGLSLDATLRIGMIMIAAMGIQGLLLH
ncbi:prenyltransferase [Paenibacillus sp. JX-17]|uniref:Prenyltransferase n=1 Tax=Paenibacillus lacisoli TaxID=3064525 RepID=A0ABT9CG99_9BACL|nr:prenyltransferase [Paenibacillus sp. JX-17]MDO7908297.1 prenyltransferase [Paenibacillus sp. JX-17]